MQRDDGPGLAVTPPTAGTIDFRVASGEHARRGCPVFLDLPGVVERPELLRSGRQRPVPCQVELMEGGTRLWWVIDGQPAGTVVDYRIELGVRQRQAPPRVAFEKAGTGWAATVKSTKAAELLFAEGGGPRIGLFVGATAITTVSHLPRPQAAAAMSTESAAVRRRIARPTIVEGPVFGQLTFEHDYVDRRDVPLWRESIQVRIFDGPEDLTLVDLVIAWHATTGPIRLFAEESTSELDPACARWRPTLRLDLAPLEEVELVALPGWRGTEIADRPAPALLAIGKDLCLAVFCRSTSFGFPPFWRIRERHVVEVSPGIAARQEQLPLGETLAEHFRFAVLRSKDAVVDATGRYFDFDTPAVVDLAPK